MTAPLIVSAGSATHAGLRRTLNEDSMLASAPVFVVADGMGGHEAGERASAAVISEFSRHIGRESLELDDVLSDNPGLKPRIAEAMARGYRRARIEAAKETGLETDAFPEACPYSFDEITARAFER